VKILSLIDSKPVKSECSIPGSILEINGNFHSKIFLHIDDTPKVLTEYLIMDIEKTFQERLEAM